MKLHMLQTNGRELRVMNCPPNGSVYHPPVPLLVPRSTCLEGCAALISTHNVAARQCHDGWRRTSAFPVEQRRPALGAAYFTGTIGSAPAIRREQSGDSTVHRVS